MTSDQLIAFEAKVADAFRAKRIAAPVHLSGGNEEQLIDIFKDVRPGDWVFSTWRSHYHALLKGIPEQWVFDEILAGRSMYLMNAEHRFLCSAIVGGILPIAAGVAMGLARKHPCNRGNDGMHSEVPCPRCDLESPRAWVFIGDMTARTGLFHEFRQYCQGHNLPVRIVVEDNGKSTNADTEATWGTSFRSEAASATKVFRYKYRRTYPHVGLAERVNF